MTKNELNRLRAMLLRLTASQRLDVLRELEGARTLDEVSAIVEKRSAERPVCAKCGAGCVVRNGRATGLQRFKCRACGVTFNALTGTSLARLRHRDKWLGQAQAMADGLSVRKTADRLKVHRTTAFRWRHRWLEVARDTKARQMAGVVEADETYHLKSYKGQKALLAVSTTREPRRRGGVGAKRGTSTDHTPILALVTRHGEATDHVLKSTNAVDIKAVLPGVLAEDAVLCTDGSSALRRAARDLGVAHEAVPTRAGNRTRGPWHIQNVNAYHSRFKGWVRRFNGISSRYLTNYLGWFRALERNARAKAPPSALLALAIDI